MAEWRPFARAEPAGRIQLRFPSAWIVRAHQGEIPRAWPESWQKVHRWPTTAGWTERL